MKLFFERNCRVDEGAYRASLSLGVATLAVAFVEQLCGSAPDGLWQQTPEARAAIRAVLEKLFKPQNMMMKVNVAAERILLMQPELETIPLPRGLPRQRAYAHACELYKIRHLAGGEAAAALPVFPPPEEEPREHRKERPRRRRKERAGK